MTEAAQHPVVIWRLMDGKPGHESQSLGLVRALERLHPVHCEDIPVAGLALGPLAWVSRRFPAGAFRPRPDLLIGAGHATHWPLLCARRAWGGATLALMKPSMPRHWFDWVVAPAHDQVDGDNVIVTQGVLNAMQPGRKRPGHALVLVGGESKHFPWDNNRVMVQVEAILARMPQARVTDSRRTPGPLRQELASRFAARYQPWESCPPGWLAAELAEAEAAWVSEDSVSMIYESLTAGCAVGLIGLARPDQPAGRLVRGIQTLERAGQVIRFDDWYAGQDRLHAPEPALREADRVAGLISGELGWRAASDGAQMAASESPRPMAK